MSLVYKSKCHCGAIELSLNMPDGLKDVRRCNCSICSKKGAIVSSVLIEDLSVIKGQNELTKYTFNTHTAEHYFCSVCGIYTHHRRRSNPYQYGVNIACIEDIDIQDYENVTYVDGKNNHPADKIDLNYEK